MTPYPVASAARDAAAQVSIRRIEWQDLTHSLREGLADFMQRPSHYVFLAFIYPVAGIVIGLAATNASAFPVLFPLVAGFAILGPIAALGFYEISRREESGERVSWRHAFDVLQSPARGAIVRMALLLCLIFALWLISASALFAWLMPEIHSPDLGTFMIDVLASPRVWTLIVLGNLIGLAFAVVAFSISVVALPLILDRHASASQAMAVSIRAVSENPQILTGWGLLIAALLVLGSIPLLVGLAVVLPVLGHATWHLYRRLIA